MSQIRIGNAPCSWGSLEFDGLSGEVIGYGQMLDELVATGYGGTELGDWGYMPTDPAVLAEELRRREVSLLGAFVPVALSDPAAQADGEAKVLRTARLLAEAHRRARFHAAPFLVLADHNGTDPVRTRHAGRIEPSMGLSDAQWEVFARGANRLARAIKHETGLRTVFHHHCAGCVETPEEIGRLLAMTDPELVGLVFDTGHYTFGSGRCDRAAAREGLERFADRIWYVHLKDCSPGVAEAARRENLDYFGAVRRGVFSELGRGCVDFPGVVSWLKQRQYQGWAVVEQDVLPGLGTPRESAQRNRDYLKSLGL